MICKEDESSVMQVCIPDRLYFRIRDVAKILHVKPYVLRYWESEFSVIQPKKSNSGHRVYQRSDVETLALVRHLLYEERYSLEGAKKRLAELKKEGTLKKLKLQVLGSGVKLLDSEELSTVFPEVSQKQAGSLPSEQIKSLVLDLRQMLEVDVSDLFGN